MTKVVKFLAVVCIAIAASTIAASDQATANQGEKVLIRATRPYDGVKQAVVAVSGRVVHEFKYVNAIAAEVPRLALPALQSILGSATITKDVQISAPKPLDVNARRGGLQGVADARDMIVDAAESLDVDSLAQAGNQPAAYLINNGIANVNSQHALGFTGLGMIVALIDSGIRPGFPHLTQDGSVIGCEDFVGDGLGCSNSANDGHGTFVAGMVSANVIFTFAAASSFRNAVLAECPACFANAPTNTQIPMIGTAPRSSIYALRVFPPTGGAPDSRVLAAIERVIELRELYNAGDPLGQDITVCNLSLGGATIAAGRDLMDQAADALLEHDIVPVIAAGNAGPSSLTVGSPGSAAGALTVGAASLPRNERILRRAQFGPVLGSLYRPFLAVQMAYFSSRGPNADGRPDPDVVSNGFANYGQGFGAANTIFLGSGTSFASPSVAGVAAVLRQRFPTATAKQIRDAIIASANPTLLSDGSTELDQGHGYVDAGAAAAMIAAGAVPDLRGLGRYNQSVKVNIETNTALNVRDGAVSESVSGLMPGQRFDLLYRVHPNVRQVVVVLHGVTPVLPPAQQNQLFGDDILLGIHSAKTSSIVEGDYKVFTFSPNGGTFVVDDPEEGVMRITVNGDWTNAGPIGASVDVYSVVDPLPQLTAQDKVANGQVLTFPLTVPSGTSTADFRLSWRENWGQYPVNDIDLILIRPDGTLDVSGATLGSPEHVALNAPAAGNWLILVEGFDVGALGTKTDKFELRVALNGKVVK